MADFKKNRKALQIQKTTAVRLDTPFSTTDLEDFLGAVRDEFPLGAVVTAEAEIDWEDQKSVSVALVATETTVSSYEPKPEAVE